MIKEQIDFDVFIKRHTSTGKYRVDIYGSTLLYATAYRYTSFDAALRGAWRYMDRYAEKAVAMVGVVSVNGKTMHIKERDCEEE